MIGALDGYDEADSVDYADMPALEKWVLHRLSEITTDHADLVKNHDHKKIFSTLFNFCTVDLSAFYFDIRKDALYCDPLNSTRRRACRTVINEVFLRLTTWLAPIMCFTMEEVWQARFGADAGSVHLEEFKGVPSEWADTSLAEHIDLIRDFRAIVSEAIEPLRKDKVIKSSLEACVKAPAKDELVKGLAALTISRKNIYDNPQDPADNLADYLIVSECDLTSGETVIVDDLKEQSTYLKCERSWKYFKASGDENITPRDAAAVAAFDAH